MPSILDMLYWVVVTPLVYIIEFTFSVLYRLVANPGLAIVGVSLVVNFLCLPLYAMADRTQAAERQKQKDMQHWIDHIKRTFKGDEQYMMLSTYYRQEGYKPIYALNGSLSLLLQIPVFMAAYNYLSSLEVLKGASFLFLTNLGAPDALIKLGGLSINVLPVLMTLLNCASTFIYTRDLGMRDKLQAYGLAALFLVLLYQSPSGLVMYWTCNQIFSLLKNVFLKVLKDPEKIFAVLVQIVLIWVLGYLLGSGAVISFGAGLICAVVLVLLDLPLLAKLFGWKSLGFSIHPEEGLTPTITFVAAAVLVSILLGVLVPSALIGSSPQEFANASGFAEPIQFVVHTACVQSGLFVLWVGTYYFLSKQPGRRAIALGLTCLAFVALVNYFFFDQNLGIIGTNLVYEDAPYFDSSAVATNLLAVTGVILAVVLAWRFAPRAINPLLVIMAAGLVWLAVPNVRAVVTLQSAESSAAQVQTVDVAAEENVTSDTSVASVDTTSTEAGKEVPFAEDGTPEPILNFSRDGSNVVVIFLDRAVSGYLPYFMNERPDLFDKFDGFTYYPNTISFGPKTVFGAPPLYGGYEYTPRAMNARDDVDLVVKHDEALLLMPTLFSQAGYEVTLFDPPLVDYQFSATDYSVFNGLANTSVYHTEGAYNSWYAKKTQSRSDGSGIDYEQLMAQSAKSLRRNLCYYGLFRTAPTCLKSDLYDQGDYLSVEAAKARIDAAYKPSDLQIAIATRTIEHVGLTINADVVSELFINSAPVVEEVVVEDVAPEATEEAVEGEYVEEEYVADESEPTEEELAAAEAAAAAAYAESMNSIVTTGYRGKQAISTSFLNWYSVLASMPDITRVNADAGQHFMLIQNSATHQPTWLQMPDYVPSLAIDNTPYTDPSVYTVDGRTLKLADEVQIQHYMIDMSALLRLGEWFDYLREQGVYDNTRIIIVADHGHHLGNEFDELQVDEYFNAEMVNPLFMFKDFGAHGFNTSYEFMTNADTPVYAMWGLIDNPVNPFTGVAITSDEKYAHDQEVTTSLQWRAGTEQVGTTFNTSGGSWYAVHDYIFDPNNWTYVE